jgi:hypothetical protein
MSAPSAQIAGYTPEQYAQHEIERLRMLMEERGLQIGLSMHWTTLELLLARAHNAGMIAGFNRAQRIVLGGDR